MSWAYLLFPVQCILQSTYYKTLGQWEYNRIYCLQPYLGCHSPYQTSGGHYWLGWSFSLARVSWYMQGDICNSYKHEYDHNIWQNMLYQHSDNATSTSFIVHNINDKEETIFSFHNIILLNSMKKPHYAENVLILMPVAGLLSYYVTSHKACFKNHSDNEPTTEFIVCNLTILELLFGKPFCCHIS